MITLTIKAANKIKEYLEQTPEASGFRINLKSGGCAGFTKQFGLDNPTKKDSVFESNGIKVIVDNSVLPMIDGSSIDFVESLNGSGFDLVNINLKGKCGCGKSICF